jgi:CTP synthase
VAETKFVVVTGGVLSGLGKGTTASSIGRLLKARGLSVTAVKIDPYVNCDAGTMNPFEHGEVFVLEDGGEVDLDLGNYERFLDTNLPQDNNITTGTVYRSVIEKERAGDYLGKTVQIVPHVTDEIRERIVGAAAKAGADVCIVEVGGTVGDIESMPFLEGLRQLHREEGDDRVVFLHTTLVPILNPVGEQKTKPTQHSVKELKATGIEPDMIVCRCEEPLDEETREKISLFCDVPTEAVVGAPDVATKYEVPIMIHEQGVDGWLVDRLDLDAGEPDLDPWKRFLDGLRSPDHQVEIAVVGKYTDLTDAYMSIEEAFAHAGSELSTDVDIAWVESEDVARGDLEELDPDGVLVPGGFGARGTEGKIEAIRYARTSGTPFLGICYGFQLSIVEFARNELGLEDATSAELMDELGIESEHPVVDLLPEQREVEDKGGTMRLGATPVRVHSGTRARELYGTDLVLERHRHRYEVNPRYRGDLTDAGLVFSGEDPTGLRVEILELPDHPFFVGSQFHPEFKSRPGDPAPLFRGLVEATVKATPS